MSSDQCVDEFLPLTEEGFAHLEQQYVRELDAVRLASCLSTEANAPSPSPSLHAAQTAKLLHDVRRLRDRFLLTTVHTPFAAGEAQWSPDECDQLCLLGFDPLAVAALCSDSFSLKTADEVVPAVLPTSPDQGRTMALLHAVRAENRVLQEHVARLEYQVRQLAHSYHMNESAAGEVGEGVTVRPFEMPFEGVAKAVHSMASEDVLPVLHSLAVALNRLEERHRGGRNVGTTTQNKTGGVPTVDPPAQAEVAAPARETSSLFGSQEEEVGTAGSALHVKYTAILNAQAVLERSRRYHYAFSPTFAKADSRDEKEEDLDTAIAKELTALRFPVPVAVQRIGPNGDYFIDRRVRIGRSTTSGELLVGPQHDKENSVSSARGVKGGQDDRAVVSLAQYLTQLYAPCLETVQASTVAGDGSSTRHTSAVAAPPRTAIRSTTQQHETSQQEQRQLVRRIRPAGGPHRTGAVIDHSEPAPARRLGTYTTEKAKLVVQPTIAPPPARSASGEGRRSSSRLSDIIARTKRESAAVPDLSALTRQELLQLKAAALTQHGRRSLSA